MRSFLLGALLALVALLVSSGSASAAWEKPGKCGIPADQQTQWASLDADNNRFSTTKVPCYIAAYTISDMLDGGPWSASKFRHTSIRARWYVKLSCRGRVDSTSNAPQPGRVIRCKVRKGEDAETDRDRVRSLRRGSIKWTTAYTG